MGMFFVYNILKAMQTRCRMDSLTIRANAKINLSLDVTGRRPDGYHDVRMIMQSVSLHDLITVSVGGGSKGIKIESNDRRMPLDNRNLAYKAAELFKTETGLDFGVNIRIVKRIPIAAGLGGGSADAAAVLIALDRLCGTKIGKKGLCDMGKKLGADVPFCIMGGTMLAEGIGDVLTPLPGIPGIDIIIARPRIRVSTAWVYQNLQLDAVGKRPDTGLLLEAIMAGDIGLLARNMVNVLESVTVSRYEVIGQIKESFIRLGAAGSLMSGSGPSVFAVFTDATAAEYAWKKLEKSRTDGSNMAGKFSKVNLYDYKPLREVVFNTLKEAIITGELKPGERLMEVQLSEKIGVSRTPVREAIRKLELEGLVEMIPRKGAHVAEITTKDIMDVLEVRATLDGLATALSAERITESELSSLKNVLTQLTTYIEKENLQGSIKKDVEFHEVIYKSSRNDKLIQIINNLREQVHRFRVIYMKDYSSPKDLIEEHIRIYDAISRRDPELARNVAIEHIKNQETTIVNALKKLNRK